METLTARQGSTSRRTITLRDAAGDPIVDTYTGAETISLSLWAGDDQTPVEATLSSAAWADFALGTITLTLDGDDLAAMTPGWYRLLVRLTTGGSTYDIYEATLLVEPQPGSGEALSTYCSYDDLRREGAWVDQLITERPSMRADCSEERHRARVWIDRQVISRARSLLDSAIAGYLPEPPWEALIPDDFESTAAGREARLEALRGFLDDDRLRLADGMVGEIAAHYSLYLLAQGQLGPTKEPTAYQALAAFHRCEAMAKLRSAVFILDVTPIDEDEDDEIVPETELVELWP